MNAFLPKPSSDNHEFNFAKSLFVKLPVSKKLVPKTLAGYFSRRFFLKIKAAKHAATAQIRTMSGANSGIVGDGDADAIGLGEIDGREASEITQTVPSPEATNTSPWYT
jgi:hypothetical protein